MNYQIIHDSNVEFMNTTSYDEIENIKEEVIRILEEFNISINDIIDSGKKHLIRPNITRYIESVFRKFNKEQKKEMIDEVIRGIFKLDKDSIVINTNGNLIIARRPNHGNNYEYINLDEIKAS